MNRFTFSSKMYLIFLALCADILITFIQVFPWVTSIVIGALFWGSPQIYWLAACAIAFFIWLFRPCLKVRSQALPVDSAQLLKQEVDTLKLQFEC